MAAEKEKPGARAPHSTCSNLQIWYTTNWGKVKGKVKPKGQKNQGSRIEQAKGAANLTEFVWFPILAGFGDSTLARLRTCVSNTDEPVARGAGGTHPREIWRGAGDCAGAAAED